MDRKKHQWEINQLSPAQPPTGHRPATWGLCLYWKSEQLNSWCRERNSTTWTRLVRRCQLIFFIFSISCKFFSNIVFYCSKNLLVIFFYNICLIPIFEASVVCFCWFSSSLSHICLIYFLLAISDYMLYLILTLLCPPILFQDWALTSTLVTLFLSFILRDFLLSSLISPEEI